MKMQITIFLVLFVHLSSWSQKNASTDGNCTDQMAFKAKGRWVKIGDLGTINSPETYKRLNVIQNLLFTIYPEPVGVDEFIRTSVNMMNIQSSQLPSSSGDPAFDRLKMDYLMNKKKYELQYSLSQTTRTGKTVIPLRLDPPGSNRLFLPSVDLTNPSDRIERKE